MSAQPKEAKESGYYGVPLSVDEMKTLVTNYIRAFKDGDGRITVVVSDAEVFAATRGAGAPLEAIAAGSTSEGSGGEAVPLPPPPQIPAPSLVIVCNHPPCW
jgi:hypothetical protein